MLQKIDKQDITTTREARRKYNTKYFRMVITEVVDRADNDLGYVIYTADKKKELYEIPKEEYENKIVGIFTGYEAEPYPLIGDMRYYEED